MSTQAIVATAGQVFAERHAKYKAEHYTYSEWEVESFDSFFKMYSELTFFNPGDVEIGQLKTVKEEVDYIFIKSKVGSIVLFKNAEGKVTYICEEWMSRCASFIRQGHTGTHGEMDTVEKLNHTFQIPDSYL